jgi:hypothetical protein
VAGEVVDTKKVYLDEFVKAWKDKTVQQLQPYLDETELLLHDMSQIFEDQDNLLKQVGIVIVYFHAFRIARAEGWTNKIERQKLVYFEKIRNDNRDKASNDLGDADYDLLEFDRYAQSPNDAYAVKFRLATFLNVALGIKKTFEEL